MSVKEPTVEAIRALLETMTGIAEWEPPAWGGEPVVTGKWYPVDMTNPTRARVAANAHEGSGDVAVCVYED
jgi:hypothetical protein